MGGRDTDTRGAKQKPGQGVRGSCFLHEVYVDDAHDPTSPSNLYEFSSYMASARGEEVRFRINWPCRCPSQDSMVAWTRCRPSKGVRVALLVVLRLVG